MRMFKRLEAAQQFGKRPDRWEFFFFSQSAWIWFDEMCTFCPFFVQCIVIAWWEGLSIVMISFISKKHPPLLYPYCAHHTLGIFLFLEQTNMPGWLTWLIYWMIITILILFLIELIIIILIIITSTTTTTSRWQMRMFKRDPEMNQEYQGSPLRWFRRIVMLIMLMLMMLMSDDDPGGFGWDDKETQRHRQLTEFWVFERLKG